MTDRFSGILKRGGVVAFPTETVYGLAADAFNPDAVKKIFHIKGRPSDNPLIVHVSDRQMAESLTRVISPAAGTLIDAFWPGPLTLVLPKRRRVLDLVTSGLATVAVRMPDHRLALQLIRQTGPLVAPSANLSGKPSPTRAEHVRQDFGLDFPVLDGGPCRIGLESTVVDVSSDPCTVLRPGFITLEDLEAVLGQHIQAGYEQDHLQPRSPGMKYSHYAPDAKVRWMLDDEHPGDPKTMYLFPGLSPAGPEKSNVKNYHHRYHELAKDLYDRFRQADLQGYAEIAIGKFDNQAALLNRIEKAMG
ncbi:MAG: L-threonylcarbamoyladenylate synthase [Balneolales bacterium]